MVRFLLHFLFVTTILCFNLNNNDNIERVVGGQQVTNRSHFSYIVSIRHLGHHFCGGSIISSKHVLTAAHCFYHIPSWFKLKNRFLRVVAGGLKSDGYEENVVVKKVAKKAGHKNFNRITLYHDIGLITIEGKFEWNEYIRPIKMATDWQPGDTCVLSGWGHTESRGKTSRNLQYVALEVHSQDKCGEIFGGDFGPDMLCAGAKGHDACQGDSGGPLVCSYKLTGVVSWGIDCGVLPGIYTEVNKYLKWIEARQNKSENCPPLKIYILFSLTFGVYLK